MASAVPRPGEVPDEAVQILAHLTQHRHVRGCVTLTTDGRVLWSGGAAFAAGEGEATDALQRVVQFVRDMLDVVMRHVDQVEAGDELSLLRVRTKKYELLVTPSTSPH